MSWLKRDRHETNHEAQHDTRVEVVVQQQATQDVVNDAIKANDELISSLELNHITLQLWIAAGGGHKKRIHS